MSQHRSPFRTSDSKKAVKEAVKKAAKDLDKLSAPLTQVFIEISLSLHLPETEADVLAWNTICTDRKRPRCNRISDGTRHRSKG